MSIKISRKINPYVMVDREVLINEELSWEAKGLYCYLASASIENINTEDLIKMLLDKFKDSNQSYIIQIINELINAGLIEKTDINNKSVSSLIKLAEFENDELDILIEKQNELNHKKLKLLKAKQEAENLDDKLGHREINYGTINKFTDDIKTQIDYDVLINKNYLSKDLIDSIVKIMTEIKLTRFQDRNKQPYRINNSLKSITEINTAFEELNMFHIEYVVENMRKAKKINNPKSYLVAALYNSLSTIDLYYQNAVLIDQNKEEDSYVK